MNTVFHGCTLSWSFRELKLVFSAVAAAAASAASASTPSSISSASTVVLVEPTVPVAVLFVVCGKLAGQPQGWGDWFRRWRWRFEGRFGRRRRRRRNHTLQPRPLGCWLAHLARSRTFQLGGQESRRQSTPARWDVPHRRPIPMSRPALLDPEGVSQPNQKVCKGQSPLPLWSDRSLLKEVSRRLFSA
jgi:hypothetical protein